MATFSTRELYGGAITVDLPREYIDASNIRQVPSHQEVFLSLTTLTSLIIELNALLPSTSDSAAASTHFTDPIAAPDTARITSTTPVSLAKDSLKSCPAFVVQGTIKTHERGEPAPVEVRTTMLLVRIAAKGTDLCVRVNVPTKELGAEERVKEEGFVREVLEEIVRSLDVRDWSLFVN